MPMARLAAALIVTTMLLAGCRSEAPQQTVVVPPAPTPVSAELRQRLATRAPDAVIGRVIAVLPDNRLAAVGDVPVTSFKREDVVTFIGSEDVTLVSGTVVEVLADAVHIRYELPADGQRAPAVGDLAVKFPKK